MAEIERVAIHHPRIDGGRRVIKVPAEAVSTYARSGWQPYETPPEQETPPPPTDPQTPDAPAEPGTSPSEQETPRRRRATTGEGQ